MALIDQWIEVAVKHEAEQNVLAGGEPQKTAQLSRADQEQLEAALREIVPPEVLLRLKNGAHFAFPYHTHGRVFHVCIEKKQGVLCMRVALRNGLNK